MKLSHVLYLSFASLLLASGSFAMTSKSNKCPAMNDLYANVMKLDRLFDDKQTQFDAIADLTDASSGDVYASTSFRALNRSWFLIVEAEDISAYTDKIQGAREQAQTAVKLGYTYAFNDDNVEDRICAYDNGNGNDGIVFAVSREGFSAHSIQFNLKQAIRHHQSNSGK